MWVSGVTVMLAVCMVGVVVIAWAVATGRIDAALVPPRREKSTKRRTDPRPSTIRHRG